MTSPPPMFHFGRSACCAAPIRTQLQPSLTLRGSLARSSRHFTPLGISFVTAAPSLFPSSSLSLSSLAVSLSNRRCHGVSLLRPIRFCFQPRRISLFLAGRQRWFARKDDYVYNPISDKHSLARCPVEFPNVIVKYNINSLG